MNIRLSADTEQRLSFFAQALHTTKTELVKPHIEQLLEDLEDYYYAEKALRECTRMYSFDEVKAMLDYVEN